MNETAMMKAKNFGAFQRVCGRCEQTDGVAFRFPRFGDEPRVAAL